MKKDVFEQFNNGVLRLSNKEINFSELPWNPHPVFEGVELKHIISGKETNNQWSYHLVRIAPNKAIKDHIHNPQLETHEIIAGTGICINDGKELIYTPGTISIIPATIHHEVIASDEGLYLFAKFFPALC